MQMCATVKFSDLLTAYKLMAFIQYTLQFADQPFVLQDDPNPSKSIEIVCGQYMLNVCPVHCTTWRTMC